MNTNNGYENAPATKMLAVFCACCAKPLVDSESVERGIGPECAKKHGFGKPQGPADFALAEKRLGGPLPSMDPHKAVNVLVHHVAVTQTGERVVSMTSAIAALGFTKVAHRIARRLGAVAVTREGDSLFVKTPKGLNDIEFAQYLAATRTIGRWDADRKAREVPAAAAPALWAALKRGLKAGTLVCGDRGVSAV